MGSRVVCMASLPRPRPDVKQSASVEGTRAAFARRVVEAAAALSGSAPSRAPVSPPRARCRHRMSRRFLLPAGNGVSDIATPLARTRKRANEPTCQSKLQSTAAIVDPKLENHYHSGFLFSKTHRYCTYRACLAAVAAGPD